MYPEIRDIGIQVVQCICISLSLSLFNTDVLRAYVSPQNAPKPFCTSFKGKRKRKERRGSNGEIRHSRFFGRGCALLNLLGDHAGKEFATAQRAPGVP